MSKGWIGVDLDGTLAEYDEWMGILHIGNPIEPMVQRVRRWIDEGHTVKIFTARASRGGEEGKLAVRFVQQWCEKWIGHRLEVTNCKDLDMIELYDDRCVQVLKNTGTLVGESTHGL